MEQEGWRPLCYDLVTKRLNVADAVQHMWRAHSTIWTLARQAAPLGPQALEQLQLACDKLSGAYRELQQKLEGMESMGVTPWLHIWTAHLPPFAEQ